MRKLDRRDHLDDVFGQMQDMFSQIQNFGSSVPVDVKEEDGKIVVSADLPGVEKDNINLKADKDGIEISAESSQEIKEENEKYVRRERSSRAFRRKVSWSSEVDPESVTANYEDGVLTVEADKEESDDWDVEIE